LNRYLLDIETYRNYFFIGIKRFREEFRRGFELSDRSNFDRDWMRRFLLQKSIVTFNGMAYDYPVALYACTRLPTGEYPTNSQIKDVSDRIIMGNVKYWEVDDVIGFPMPRPWDIDHVDMVEPQPNPFASLKILNGRLHGKQMQDLPYEPDRILTHDEMDKVSHYCLQNDLDASELLFEALQEPMELREALGADLKQDLRSKSDTQAGLAIIKKRAEEVLGRRIDRPNVKPGQTFKYKAPSFIKFNRPEMQELLTKIQEHNFVVDDKGKVELPKWLSDMEIALGSSVYSMGIGGLHSTESNRAVLSDDTHVLIDSDVGSFYPAIILSLGLYPEAIGPKFLDIYKGLREDRMVAKRRAKVLKKEISELEIRIAELEGEKNG
jgi:hypothetical protein